MKIKAMLFFSVSLVLFIFAKLVILIHNANYDATQSAAFFTSDKKRGREN